jgi:hypothetical protein
LTAFQDQLISDHTTTLAGGWGAGPTHEPSQAMTKIPPRLGFKGIVSQDEYFFGRLLIVNRSLMVFTIFCFLVDEKSKLKVLAYSFEITY